MFPCYVSIIQQIEGKTQKICNVHKMFTIEIKSLENT